jgi:hypothetical protein
VEVEASARVEVPMKVELFQMELELCYGPVELPSTASGEVRILSVLTWRAYSVAASHNYKRWQGAQRSAKRCGCLLWCFTKVFFRKRNLRNVKIASDLDKFGESGLAKLICLAIGSRTIVRSFKYR